MKVNKGPIIKYLGVYALGIFSVVNCFHYLYNHNKVYDDIDLGKCYKKVDFPLGLTHISIKDGKTIMTRTKGFGSTDFIELSGDENVDIIEDTSPFGSRKRILSSSEEHNKRFEKANRDYREQIKRFRPLTQRK